MSAFVLLVALLCPIHAGEPSHDCDDIEVRARSCPEAAMAARQWLPAGWAIMAAECREERQASR